ncbi:MAG: CvpA family protein [Bariatricus sp.]
MNWLLIVVAGILLLGVLVGFVRGAVRIAVSLVATLLTMAVVFVATPYVSKAVISLTPVDEMLEKQCTQTITKLLSGGQSTEGLTEEQVRSILAGAGVTEEQLAAAGITVQDIVDGKVSGEDLAKYGISAGILEGHTQEKAAEILNDAEIPRQTQIAAIEAADIPDVFKELLLSNNNSEVYRALGANTFMEYISKYFAKLIIDIVSFLGTFLVVTIIVRAIVFALDFVTELPVLGILNRLAGMLVGGSVSLIIVGFIFVVITLLYTTEIGKVLMGMIREDEFLTLLYEHNYIMKLITVFR